MLCLLFLRGISCEGDEGGYLIYFDSFSECVLDCFISSYLIISYPYPIYGLMKKNLVLQLI